MTTGRLTVRKSPLLDVGENLSLEWARVKALDDAAAPPPRPELLFYVNAPCVVLGRTRKVSLDLTEAALATPTGFLARRRSGGGTVYQDENNLNFSITLPTDWPGLPQSPRAAAAFVLSSLARTLGAHHAQIERISDVTFAGKKISGNAQYRGRRVLLHHGTLLLSADKPAMDRWLRLPPERPDIPHGDFVADLAGFGFDPAPAHWCERLAAAFGELLGLTPVWEDFDNTALLQAQADGGVFVAPDWVRRFV